MTAQTTMTEMQARIAATPRRRVVDRSIQVDPVSWTRTGLRSAGVRTGPIVLSTKPRYGAAPADGTVSPRIEGPKN